jgi:hypothetical protein
MDAPDPVAEGGGMTGTVVLVEGQSDRLALEAAAASRGRDLTAERIAVVPMGGAHAVRRYLATFGPQGEGLRVAGLCDSGEAEVFRRGLVAARLGSPRTSEDMEALGFFVCHDDLEDELIRALGAAAVEAVLETQGDLRRFRVMQDQPAWRGRAPEEQLRRFLGSGARRKARYAGPLAEAAAARNRLPRPIDALLAWLLSGNRVASQQHRAAEVPGGTPAPGVRGGTPAGSSPRRGAAPR